MNARKRNLEDEVDHERRAQMSQCESDILESASEAPIVNASTKVDKPQGFIEVISILKDPYARKKT